MKKAFTILAVLSAALSVSLGLVGCGSSDESSAPAAPASKNQTAAPISSAQAAPATSSQAPDGVK